MRVASYRLTRAAGNSCVSSPARVSPSSFSASDAPQRLVVVHRQAGRERLVPLVDRDRGRAVLELGRLRREEDVADRGVEAAARARHAHEAVGDELVEQQRQRDARAGGDRIAQCERAVGGQLLHQPFGQRLQPLVLLGLGFDVQAGNGDDGALDRRSAAAVHCARLAVGSRVRLIVVVLLGHLRRLVLGTHEAALDLQPSRAVDADEGTRAAGLGRIERRRTRVEHVERRLDLAEPLIDIVRQVVGRVGILLLDRAILGLERVVGDLLLVGEDRAVALEPPEATLVAVGKVDRDLDPLPAFARDRLRLLAQLLGREQLDQSGILQPSAVVVLEQVSQRRAAGLLIGSDADERGAAIGGAHRAFGQHAANLVRLAVGLAADRVPDAQLALMVGRDGERHEQVEPDLVLGIEVEQRRGDRRETQPLLDHGGRHEEARRDVVDAGASVDLGLEGAELVERVQVLALGVLG